MFFSYKDIFRDGEKIAMRHSVWVPGKLDVHTHDFFEIAYIIKGSGYHFLADETHMVHTGDLFLLTPNGPHNFRPDKGGVLEWINCMFLPDVIDPNLIGITSTTDLLKALIFFDSMQFDTSGMSGIELLSNIEDLNKIFKDMTNEYKTQAAGYQEALKAYLQILLIKIFRAHYLKINDMGESGQHKKITNIVLAHLQEITLKQNIKIDELAHQAFYSPQHFRKLFREETGVGLSAYIRGKRLDAAAELLVDSDMPVLQIMEQVGFNDSKSFYAAFDKMYGLTPAQYRNKFGSGTSEN